MYFKVMNHYNNVCNVCNNAFMYVNYTVSLYCMYVSLYVIILLKITSIQIKINERMQDSNRRKYAFLHYS